MDLSPLPSLTHPLIIAGPCSAESEAQIISAAKDLARSGRISVFRAGLWKPRTKPGCFEGVGAKGLKWLIKAKETTGLPIATEVATPDHVRAVSDAGIDMVWIGARTTANPFAVQDIADAIGKLNPGLPVFVKNPVNPDIELWIGAIERLFKAGVTCLGAIHRGFSVYGPHIYRNKPCWSIPFELKRRIPALPVICDPSHIGGSREYVAPLAHQAIDMGFDGLIIECHPDPAKALSDAQQQLTPDMLEQLIATLSPRNPCSSDDRIATLRSKIDGVDRDILELIAKRMNLTDEIGRIKAADNLSVVQRERYRAMMEIRHKWADTLGINETLADAIFTAIHEDSVKRQIEMVSRSVRR